MRRVENQIEATAPQPLGAALTSRFIDTIAQVPDAPFLNADDRIQTTVARQHLHRRLGADTCDPRIRHTRAKRIDHRQLHNQVTNAVMQTQ